MVLRVFWNVGTGLVQRALAAKGAVKPGMALKYPAVWRARPGFMDCDINLHLNNASYLFNMELARWHFSAYDVSCVLMLIVEFVHLLTKPRLLVLHDAARQASCTTR